MTEGTSLAIITAIIASAPPTLLAIAAVVKSTAAAKTSQEAVDAVKEVHITFNSRMDELLKSRRKEGFDEGIATGRADNVVDVANVAAADTNEMLRELLAILKSKRK